MQWYISVKYIRACSATRKVHNYCTYTYLHHSNFDVVTFLQLQIVFFSTPLCLRFSFLMCHSLSIHKTYPDYFSNSDLALRSCLLTSEMSVKIGDYGLSHSRYKVRLAFNHFLDAFSQPHCMNNSICALFF